MKLEITKGQWGACLNWDENNIEIGTPENEQIALVNKNYAESESNAKVISVAPKMYEMLLDIYAWAEQEQRRIGHPDFLNEIDNLIDELS